MTATQTRACSTQALDAYASNPPAGLRLASALAGAVFAWAWVVCVLFVGQERIMGDISQSLMLAGAAVALTAFAALDLAAGRGPELGRTTMRVAATAISACTLLLALSPLGEGVPPVALNACWVAYGVVGAYAQRRSFHLLASLAGSLDGRHLLRVACAVLALATLLCLMAARMSVHDGAVFMIASATAAIWLLPQGRLAVAADGVQAAGRGNAQASGTGTVRLLAPFAFMFVVIGFTCGFHTSVGRVLYSGAERFSNVFFVMFVACAVCALIGKRSRRQGGGVPAVALQAPLALACVAFVPLLFLNDRPDDLLWEIFQNTLVLLSTCALLGSLSMVACADGAAGSAARPGAGQARRTSLPFCAIGLAAFAVGLFVGWLAGQGSYDMGGAAGMAFRLGVTACIALLVAAVLVASTPMAQGGHPAQAAESLAQAGAQNAGGAQEGPALAQAAEPATEVRRAAGADVASAPCASPSATGGDALEACEGATGADAGAAQPGPEAALDTFCQRFGLSERERVLLALLAEGLNAQQAAERLTVSRNTVKSHMAHIYTKCGIHTRSELDELLEGHRAGLGETAGA